MSKMYNRTISREIRHSLGRFIAIIAIVALGVGFLVGILSSTPDMEATADQYYLDAALSDYDIKSTMGFTQEDIDALYEVPEIDNIMAAKAMDMLVEADDALIAGRIYGLDLDNVTVNKLELLEGRMPENETECVIEKPAVNLEKIKIGQTITISGENEDADEYFNQKEFTVVGIVNSPYYYSIAEEPSNVGAGRIGTILYTWETAYKTDVWTDLFIVTKNTHSAFTDDYDNYIDKVTDDIKAVSKERIPARKDQILAEARQELQDAKDTLASKKANTEADLAKAQADLDAGWQDYEACLKQLQDYEAQLDQLKGQLDASREQVEAAKQAQANGYPLPQEALEAIAQYDAGMAAWEAGQRDVEAGYLQLEEAAVSLASGQAELDAGRLEVQSAFAKADREIASAEAEIASLEDPEWFILDRDSNVSHARYSVDVGKVADVATVFPIFFFLIAALVTLTTMTRMVEEERIQIGTLKALGYSRMRIISKYLVYCGLATVAGCAIGLVVGFSSLPSILFAIYSGQYDLPPLILQFNWKFALVSCGLELLCTLGTTWIACANTLKEKPSQLMVPRAPKAGKRILLERISFIWKHLSFSYKATFRNIFRYKKHMFMTIIGVAGCTSLMVAGFGIQDSLTTLVKTQYDDILKYDMRIQLTEEATDDVLADFLEGKDSLATMTAAVDVSADSNKELISSTLCVPAEADRLDSFVTLRTDGSHEAVAFGPDSVIITQKMADVLEASTGDTITVTDADGISRQLKLSGTTENYAGCYIYIGPEAYLQAGFPQALEYNSFLLNSGIEGREAQDEAASRLSESSYVASTEFTSQSRSTYESILASLDLLVAVLIIFSGLLAAVVLYNLTNININERIRELSTLRVLGYHHKEVCAYIFREIVILTLLGTAAGLVVGKVLHYYIALVAESPDMVFGKALDTSTFLLAALFTLLFSLLVNFLMTFKIRRIDMASSMKAID